MKILTDLDVKQVMRRLGLSQNSQNPVEDQIRRDAERDLSSRNRGDRRRHGHALLPSMGPEMMPSSGSSRPYSSKHHSSHHGHGHGHGNHHHSSSSSRYPPLFHPHREGREITLEVRKTKNKIIIHPPSPSQQ